jgi:acetyl esterase/lipase
MQNIPSTADRADQPVTIRPTLPPIPPGVRAVLDLQYVPGGDPAQMLDLFLPETRPESPRPLIIWIHGGGWSKGARNPGQAIHFVSRGYIVAGIGYRFSQVAKWPAQIQDCQAAIRWLRANASDYGIDRDRIGVWGSSAGGHLCNMLGTAGGQNTFGPVGGNPDQSDRVQAVCSYCGPSNFRSVRAQSESDTEVKTLVTFDDWTDPYSNLIGELLGKNSAAEDAASPTHYVRRDPLNPPFLLVHGTADQHVPFAQAQELADLLQKHNVKVHLHPLPGGDHKTPMYYARETLDVVQSFFDRNLKPATAATRHMPTHTP